ncbi:RNA-binding protein 26-like isoform X2 [Acipenser oxyrinchus oxyrinchus]|uniref:RNA-binding protein 26-like isoform X2 n=1 Tax=Acipenser oxyrinchus oxyrinchus TaxID=40147 RepID=A0AAD8G722_ACIOX|nr:RNA-binding protein 26-like isoform X2 [Acipenser oxyrinchus oxyrinchus]
MIIENLEALKSWLSKTLEPICDADPSALAKYVVALVKKDKTEKELKALCIDQLDVFLQKDTQIFVDKLFEAVNSKSYLPQFEQPSSTTVRTEPFQHPEKDDVKKDEQVNKEEERDTKKFPRRINHSPQQSSSRYRDSRIRDDRKKDDRSRKRDYERNPPRRDSYRDRYNRRRGRSYSRSRSRSKERPRDRDRSRTRSRSRTSRAPTHHGNNTSESWSEFHEDQIDHGSYGRGPPPKKRCRDYDEKGFCMRGDMCLFDHGSDPVVVEDVNLPGMLPFPAQPPPVEGPPPPGLPPPPPMMTPPPLNLRPPGPPPSPLPPSLPLVTGPPPSLPPLQPLQPSGMDASPNSITGSVPPIVTSVIRHPPPQAQPPLFTSETYEPDVYNPEAPSITSTSRPVYRHRAHAQRPNLIGLTLGEVDLPPRENPANNSMRIVVESRKRATGTVDSGMLSKKPWLDKQNFSNPNNLGFQKKMQFGAENAKLEIRKIPLELNNIRKLNEHFCKFGTIVNLQVAYKSNPEGALIQFSSHEEAKRAMSSTEAVLNNRFIKVFWHQEDIAPQLQPMAQQVHQTSAQQPSVSALKHSVKDRLGPIPTATTEPTQPQPSNTVSTQNTGKLSVKERLGFCSKPSAVANQKVLSTSMGLTKTVYNPAALKAIQKTMPFVNTGVADHSETLKKKQEALRLQQDVRKKKQEIVGKHIETQKILISKLEKNKTMKPEDKAEIMKTLKTLTNSITKLKDELKAISSGIPHKTMKTRAQMQKELLDSELDLYKKMQAGEDVAQLRKKYTELQLEAAKRGILSSGHGRGGHAWGRGALRSRGRGMRGRGRGAPLYAVVDHRPRALEISGFTEPDREDLLPYFAQFGEIEDWQIDDLSLNAVITYRTRAEAEAAAVHGARFKGQDLKLAWHKPVTTLTNADPEEAEPDEEEFQSESLLDDALLQDDDEEEDDNESRAWRR